MSDSHVDGQEIRLLNKKDDFHGQCLSIEVDTLLPCLRVMRVLEKLIGKCGKQASIYSHNGPDFIPHKLQHWCIEKEITMQFIQPARLMQNAYIERKNRSMRRELLKAYLFHSLPEVRVSAEQ